MRQSFAAGRPEEHERLLRALLEACAFCDVPDNRALLSDMLSHPQYVNAPADCVQAGLNGKSARHGEVEQSSTNSTVFYGHGANDPTDEKARWIMEGLYELLQRSPFRMNGLGGAPVLKNIFRRDIYEQAVAGSREPLTPALAAQSL